MVLLEPCLSLSLRPWRGRVLTLVNPELVRWLRRHVAVRWRRLVAERGLFLAAVVEGRHVAVRWRRLVAVQGPAPAAVWGRRRAAEP